MADFLISFRIKEDWNSDKRYEDLKDAVLMHSTKYWDETTSLYLVRTELSIDKLGQELKSAINENVDKLFVRQIGVNATRYCGAFTDDDFFEFFPDAKKL